MKLGVPTLCRYDLLARLIERAENGSVKPTEYVIIDNGGTFVPPAGVANVRVIVPGKNIGVAASWNLLLDDAGDEPIVISNDDVVFGEHTFRDMVHGTTLSPFVEGGGWYLFAQSPECTKRVGYYDENYWPAYYEDSDFQVRLHRAGMQRLKPLTEPFVHDEMATSKAIDDTWIREARERNRQYFLRKWGGRMLGSDLIQLFGAPWGGTPPPGWRLRSPERSEPVMRWDVLNRIARKIGATRYLEIGVSTGECMRRVDILEKWGVDPAPTPEAVKAATYFFGHTSEEFFRVNSDPYPAALRLQFDLVFIDGYHEAEHVYREVMLALGCLRAGGVIVLHDCNPSSEAMQSMDTPWGDWTGNVWKAVALLRSEGCCMRVVDDDYGIGILVRSRVVPPIALDKPWDALEWSDLQANREQLLGLLRPPEWEAWFDEVYGRHGMRKERSDAP